MVRVAAACLAALVLAPLSGCAAAAQTPRVAPGDWHDVKCARYRAAWSSALEHFGTRGLSADFIARHEAYLASNCTRRAEVCPRSREELRIANVLVEMSMNFGAASTFAPFACR